jgi:diaminopimelate epimerase
MRFVKMHGIGNDYVYIDDVEHRLGDHGIDPAALARFVADRHTGVGSDGLILVAPPSQGSEAHVRMRMFNADGSESEMCGNGIRCVAKFAVDRGLARANPLKVETGRGVLEIRWTIGADGTVERATVDMGRPILDAAGVPAVVPAVGRDARIVAHSVGRDFFRIEGHGSAWIDEVGLVPAITCVSMGNPHVVVFVRDVERVPLERIGPVLETHAWFPRRINVHVVEVRSTREVVMRTWERGSGITRACGTGASAVCVAGVLEGRTDRAILAHLPGGDLELEWPSDSSSVFMTGPATEVFEGVLAPAVYRDACRGVQGRHPAGVGA